MKRKYLSFFIRLAAIFVAFVAFAQVAACLEGTSALWQGALIAPLCGWLSYALGRLDARMMCRARRRTLHIARQAPTPAQVA